MIITFRFFFTEPIKKRIQNNKQYMENLSQYLRELWEQNKTSTFFFGVFNEKVRLNKIEFSIWSKKDFDNIISRFDKSWDSIMVNFFSHVNGIKTGEKIEGFFADIRIDTETGAISVRPIDDLDEYTTPQGEES